MRRSSSVLVLCFGNITVCPVWWKVTVKFNQGKTCECAICINVTSTQTEISPFFVSFRPWIRPLLLFFAGAALSPPLPAPYSSCEVILPRAGKTLADVKPEGSFHPRWPIGHSNSPPTWRRRRMSYSSSWVHGQCCLNMWKTQSHKVQTTITNKTEGSAAAFWSEKSVFWRVTFISKLHSKHNLRDASVTRHFFSFST